MSGIGARAIVKTPCVVTTMNPAAKPAARPHSRHPIHEVASDTPRAAMRDGHSALDFETSPPGPAATAMSHANRGGLLR